MTEAAGRKAAPIYRVISPKPIKRDDAMNKDKVGFITYMVRRIMQARVKVIKSGSDQAHECNLRIGADDMYSNTARMVGKKLRPADKNTANAISPTFMPKRIAFRMRAP
jgi:hypothetical protein